MALDGIVIRSRQNTGVKLACALLEKKTREKERLFRFDGIKLFSEAVSCGVGIERVYVRESSCGTLKERIGEKLELLEGLMAVKE